MSISHTRTMAACLADAEREISTETLRQYWHNPAFAAQVDAERDRARRLNNTIIDCAMIRAGNRWPAHWTDDEKAAATERLLGSDRLSEELI